MSDFTDPGLMQDFLTEAGELIEQLDVDLVELESASEQQAADLINSIFRALHTVKGAASFLALDTVIRFAHAAEDALNKLRKGEAQVTPHVIDILLRSADVLRQQIEDLGDGREAVACPPELLSELHQITNGKQAETTETASPTTEDEATEPETQAQDTQELSLPPQKADLVSFMAADLSDALEQIEHCLEDIKDASSRTDACQQMVEITGGMVKISEFFELESLDQLVNVFHETSKIIDSIEEEKIEPLCQHLVIIHKIIAEHTDFLSDCKVYLKCCDKEILRLQQLISGEYEPPAPEPMQVEISSDTPASDTTASDVNTQSTERKIRGTGGDRTIRVEVSRLESLLNMVGQLVLTKNRVLGLNRRINESEFSPELIEDFSNAANELDQLTSNLQIGVTQTRMQPLAKLFDRYPRVIRDIARATDKDIQLEIVGRDTEVDKSVLELLGDPLVHLLRNAADHGVETPDKREQAGKNPQGKITLSAEHQGSHVRIAIQDDGKGIDREVVGNKAIEQGLVTPEQLNAMPDSDVYKFIFAAGFSTAEQVSDLSGRGVGMDVVKTNIRKMNGNINIQSEVNKGSTIEILIPLTVAIMPAMVVEVDSELYCVPLQNIVEIVRTDDSNLESIDNHPVMRLRDSVLPLIDLRQILDSPSGDQAGKFAVVVHLAEQQAGLLVDRLIGQQEIVIKPLDDTHTSGGPFSGATIQDDGRVSLILYVNQVMQHTVPHGNYSSGRSAA